MAFCVDGDERGSASSRTGSDTPHPKKKKILAVENARERLVRKDFIVYQLSLLGAQGGNVEGECHVLVSQTVLRQGP